MMILTFSFSDLNMWTFDPDFVEKTTEVICGVNSYINIVAFQIPLPSSPFLPSHSLVVVMPHISSPRPYIPIGMYYALR